MNLNDLIAEAQALDTTTLEGLKPAVDKLITDLQAFQPTSEPVNVNVTTTSLTQNLSDGSTVTFVPQA